MEFLSFTWYYVIIFLVTLTILVFVHELGHYWVARRNGVRVEVFSVGFGPEVYGWTDRAGTRWKISWIPLGGYVKMFGEHDFEPDADDSEMSEEDRAVSFHHKRLGQRTAIVAAGPIANFVFAIILLAGLFGIVGTPRPLAGVGTVIEGSAAEAAGFETGDHIDSIDGTPIVWFEDLRLYVRARPETQMSFVVTRDGGTVDLIATPKGTDEAGEDGVVERIGRLGVGPDAAQIGYERMSLLAAGGAAVERTFGLVWQIMTALGQIIAGTRTTEELGGPLRIAQISGDMAQGGVVNLIFFMAALSVNLGLVNLFPIPMLDGGHLAFYLIEAVRGKPLGLRAQEYSFRFGLILVLLLMILVTWNDIINLKVFEFFRQLVT